jgi:hypothetical protein
VVIVVEVGGVTDKPVPVPTDVVNPALEYHVNVPAAQVPDSVVGEPLHTAVGLALTLLGADGGAVTATATDLAVLLQVVVLLTQAT